MLGQYLLKQLDELRDSHTMCDLTLVSRDGTYAYVHYLIFTAFNKRHFMVARKQQTALQEVGQRKVMPLNITSEELTIFVTFIYGKTIIQKSRYDLLVSALRKLDMEHLLQECGGLTVKHEEPDIKMEQTDSIDGTSVIDGPPTSISILETVETTPDTDNIQTLGQILSIDPTSNTSLNSSEDSEQNPLNIEANSQGSKRDSVSVIGSVDADNNLITEQGPNLDVVRVFDFSCDTLKESKHDSEVIATMGIDSNFIPEIKQEEFKVAQGLNVDPVIDTPPGLSEYSEHVPLNVVFTSEDRGHSNITKTKRDKFMESTTESTYLTDNFYHSDKKNYITENVTSSFEGCCALDKDVFLKEETNDEKLTLELSDHNSAQKDIGVECADRQNRSNNTMKTYAEIFSHLKCETLLPVEHDDNEKQMTKEKESASNQEASRLFSYTDSLKSSDKVIEINVSSSEKENLSTVKDNKNESESQETFSLVVEAPGECSQCDKHLPDARQPANNTGATTPVESEGVHLIAKSVITKLNNLIDTKGNQEITAKDINLAIPVSSLSQTVLANKSNINDSVFGKNQSAFQIESHGVFNDEQQSTSGNQATISSNSLQRLSSTCPSNEKSPGGSLLQQILQIPSMFTVNRGQYKHIAHIPVTTAGLAVAATKNQSLTVSPARHISKIKKTPEMIHQNVESKKTNPPFLEPKKTLIGASKQFQASKNSEKDKNIDDNELENTVHVSTASELSSTELKLQNINIVAPSGTNSSEPNRLTSNYLPISIKGSPIPVNARIQKFKNIQFQLTQSAGTKVKNEDIQPKHENMGDNASNTSDEDSHALSHMSKKIAKLHVTIGRRQLLKRRNILPHGFASKQVGLSSVYPSLSSLLTIVTPNDLQKGGSMGSSFESGKNRSENKVIYREDICEKNFEDCNKETSDANIETVDNHVFYKDIGDREPENPVLSKDISDLKCEVSEKDICHMTIEPSENSFHFVDVGELKCEDSKGPVVSVETKKKASELPVLAKDSDDTKYEASEIHVFSRGIREDTENLSKKTENVICLEKNPELHPSNIPQSEILKILSAPVLYSCNSLPLNNKSTEAKSVFGIDTYKKNMVSGTTLCSTLVKLPEDCTSLANSEVATSPTLEKKHSYQTQSAVNHHTVAIKTPQTCNGTHKSSVMHPCQSKSKMSDCFISQNSMLGNTESIVLLAGCATPTSVMTPLKIPETSSILSTTHKLLIPLFESPKLPKTNTSKEKKGSKRSKMSKSSPKNSEFHKSVASPASSLPIQLITGPIQLPVNAPISSATIPKASPLRNFIIIPPISSPSPGLLPTIMSGQNKSLYLPPVSCPSRMPMMANASSLLLDTSTSLKQTSPCGSRQLKPLKPKPLFTLPVNTNFSSGGPITLIPYTANLTSTTPSHTIRNAVLVQNAPVIPLKFDTSTHIPTDKNEEAVKRCVNVEENPDIGGLASVDLPGIQIANYSESDDASDPVAQLAAKLNTDHLQCNSGKVNKENVCSVVQGKRKARFCTANATKKIKTRPLASRTGPVTTSYQKTDQTAQISPASEHGNCTAACCENDRGSEKNEKSMESSESFCNKSSAYYDGRHLCHRNIDGAIDLSVANDFSDDDLPLSHLARKRHKTDSDIPGQNQDKPAPANVNIKHLVGATSSLPSPQLLVTHLTSEKKVPRKVKMSRRRNTALWSCKLKTMIMKGNNDK